MLNNVICIDMIPEGWRCVPIQVPRYWYVDTGVQRLVYLMHVFYADIFNNEDEICFIKMYPSVYIYYIFIATSWYG